MKELYLRENVVKADQGILHGHSQDSDCFPLDLWSDERVKRVMCRELDLETKLLGQHILQVDKLDEREPLGVEIHVDVEITVWKRVTSCARAIDIEGSGPERPDSLTA